MVLEVTCELACRYTEQIFDKVTGETDTLVGVVVLVVGVSAFNGHLENLADDSAEVNGLLLTVFNLVAQVREKLTV